MAANTEWEDFPTYSEVADSLQKLVVNLYQESKNESRSVESIWRYYNFTTNDILFIILLAIIWTVFRHLTSEMIFKPLAQYCDLSPINQSKVPESAWRFLYYLCVWSYAVYVIILSGRYTFYQKPSTVWEGWNLEDDPPVDIYLLYMAQCGFYLHFLYCTLFLDIWRKDSQVLLFHHVLTISLLSVSYSFRCHNIGTVVLLFHDIGDVVLEFTKLNVYFKIQGGKLIKIHELLANVSFVVFTIVWFVSRMYYFPMRVLYVLATYNVLYLPCALLLNGLVWILQILNIYWSLFIVKLLYRVATGQTHEVDDTREYDVEEKFKLSTKRTAKTNNGSDDDVILKGDIKKRSKKAD